MSYDIGPRIGIEGEAEFRKQIRLVNESLKTLDTEMKAVSSSYGKNDQSVGKLAAQQKILTAQIGMQLQKLLAMREGLEQAKAKYGENSEVTQKWRQQLNRATEQMNLLDRTLQENEQALEQAKRAASEQGRAEEEAARAAEALARAHQEACAQIARTSDQLGKASDAMRGVNQAALVLTAACTALAGAAVKVGMDFEAQMSKVEAISGATAEQMQVLSDRAKEMGAATKFSATESAEALQYMAMAGWKAGEMADGLPGTINLAAASGEDLALTSDIVTDALTAFGLKAEDSAHFADVLAAASSNSNTNVAMMGETFKYAAPVAGALGYSIDDAAVAIGLMANSGVKAEMAGTALRGMLTNLSKPSDQVQGYMDKLGLSLTDLSGEVKPLNQLLVEMQQKFSRLTDAQKAEYAAGIAGKNAMSGMLALVNAAPADMEKLTKAIARSDGIAKRMADTMNRNLKGQLTLLASAAEGVGIAFYEKFEKQAAGAVKALADKVSAFGQALATGQLDGALGGVAAAAAAAGTAIVGMNAVLMVKDVANFASAVRIGGEALEGYAAATRAGAAAQKALNLAQSLSPVGLLVIALAAAGAGLAVYARNAGLSETETDRLADRMDELTGRVQEYRDEQERLGDERDKAINSSLSELHHLQSMTDELDTLRDATGKVKDGEEERARILSEMINEILPDAVKWTQEQGNAYVTTADHLDALIQKETLKSWIDANGVGYQAAMENQRKYIKDITTLTQELEKNRQQLQTLQQEQAAAVNAGDIYQSDQLQAEMDKVNQKIREGEQAVSDLKNGHAESTRMIMEMEDAKAALVSEDADKISAVLDRLTLDLKKYTGDNLAELEQQAKNEQDNLDTLLKMHQEHAESVTREELDEQRSRAQEARVIADQAGKEEVESHAAGMRAARGFALDAAQAVYTAAVAALGNQEGASVSGEYFAEGYAKGIRTRVETVTDAAQFIAQAALRTLKTTQKEGSPSKLTMLSGAFFSMGMALGIAKKAGAVQSAAREMAQDAVTATAKAAKTCDFSDFEQNVGKGIVRSIEDGLQKEKPRVIKTAGELSRHILREAESWVGDKKFYQELALADELAFWEKLKAMEGLQADELAEIDKKIYTAKRELAEQEASVIEEQQKQQEKALEEYERALESRTSALAGFSGLFDQIESDSKVTGGQLLANLRGQVDAFEEWQADITKLEERGVTGPLLEELQALGPKAAKEIAALSTLTEDQLDEYIALFAEKGRLAQEQAESELGVFALQVDETQIRAQAGVVQTVVAQVAEGVTGGAARIGGAAQQIQAAISSLFAFPEPPDPGTGEKAAAAGGGGLAKKFLDSICAQTGRAADAAGTLVTAFNTQVADQEEAVQASGTLIVDRLTGMIREKQPLVVDASGKTAQSFIRTANSFKGGYDEVGANMMRGVLDGVQSGRSGLINGIVETLQEAVQAARMAMDIHSPSKVWAEIGDYMAQGLGVGYAGRMRAVSRQIADSLPTALPETPAGAMARISEATVNGVASAMQGGGSGKGQPVIIQLMLNDKQLAQVLYDPLQGVARQRGAANGSY